MFDDLKHLMTKDRNIQSISECLRTIALVRYASLPQLKTLKYAWTKHVAQNKFFRALLEFNYIQQVNLEYWHITLKALKLLELPQFLKNGQLRHRAEVVDEHQQAVTNTLLKIIQEPDFYTVFYPSFQKDGQPYLRPDAGLVFKKDDKVKLVFLEVERYGKGINYLVEKNEKYQTIARSMTTYNYLKGWFETMRLKVVEPERFCFSVLCVGGTIYEWSAWEWQNIIKN